MNDSIDISKDISKYKNLLITWEVDPNMIHETTLKEPDLALYDVRNDPFEIYGLYNPKSDDVFRRLPYEVAEATNPGLRKLHRDTAGGRIRFTTDSKYVAIKAVMPFVGQMAHVSLLGSSGFDMYIDYDEPGVMSRYCGAFQPKVGMTNGYESIIRFPDRRMRHLTINMPPYNHVDRLYIGLQNDARIEGGKKYINKKPIIFYGSSITQGACSSRPGLNYQNMLARRFEVDYINLGFSGNGRAEIPIVEYMAGLDISMFVSDYDHNAPNPDYLKQTHKRMYDMIREKHPDIPYIMLSRPDFDCGYDESILRRNVIMETYRLAREAGDKNVYYIDGAGIFRGPDEDMCTVDRTHPSDIGFAKMADAIGETMLRAMRKKSLAD